MGAFFSFLNLHFPSARHEESTNINTADWMKTTFASAPHIPLVHIIIPGTHDSATNLLNERTLRQDLSPSNTIRRIPSTKQTRNFLVGMARTQMIAGGLVAQLEAGVRYFDLRLIWVNNVPYFRHGDIVFNTNVFTEFANVAGFMRDHADEFYFLKFSHFSFINTPGPDEIISRFARIIVDLMGESRVATIHDDLTQQTYQTQVLQRRRNVAIVFDIQGNWVFSSPPQVIPSSNVWITRYDPNVRNNIKVLIQSARRVAQEFESKLNVFRNVQLHYQYDTKTFGIQALQTQSLRIHFPDNLALIEYLVMPLAQKPNLSVNIVTFDNYTSELTSFVVRANKLRLQSFI